MRMFQARLNTWWTASILIVAIATPAGSALARDESFRPELSDDFLQLLERLEGRSDLLRERRLADALKNSAASARNPAPQHAPSHAVPAPPACTTRWGSLYGLCWKIERRHFPRHNAAGPFRGGRTDRAAIPPDCLLTSSHWSDTPVERARLQ